MVFVVFGRWAGATTSDLALIANAPAEKGRVDLGGRPPSANPAPENRLPTRSDPWIKLRPGTSA
jgi:hypothetical protein